MQRMRREGVEGAPGLVPWRGKGRSGTGVFAWCLSEFVGIEYKQPNSLGPTEVIRSTRSPGTMFIMRGHVTVVSRYHAANGRGWNKKVLQVQKNGLNEFDTRILCGIFNIILRSGATGQLKQLQFT